MFFVQDNLAVPVSVLEAVIGPIAVKEAPVEVLNEDVDGLLPPQVRSVARPGEDDGKDALVGGELEREAPATGGIVTHGQKKAGDLECMQPSMLQGEFTT